MSWQDILKTNLGMADIAGDKPSEEHEWCPMCEDWHDPKQMQEIHGEEKKYMGRSDDERYDLTSRRDPQMEADQAKYMKKLKGDAIDGMGIVLKFLDNYYSTHETPTYMKAEALLKEIEGMYSGDEK